MNQKHPGEERLQQYVLEISSIDSEILSHIEKCELCKARVGVYEALFSGIKNQEAPVFDFDLSKAVLAELPKPVTKYSPDKNLVYAIISFSVVFLVATWLLLNEVLPAMFSGTNSILIYLMLITILIVFIFHVTDILKNYQKKIKALDFN